MPSNDTGGVCVTSGECARVVEHQCLHGIKGERPLHVGTALLQRVVTEVQLRNKPKQTSTKTNEDQQYVYANAAAMICADHTGTPWFPLMMHHTSRIDATPRSMNIALGAELLLSTAC